MNTDPGTLWRVVRTGAIYRVVEVTPQPWIPGALSHLIEVVSGSRSYEPGFQMWCCESWFRTDAVPFEE